MFGLFAKPIVFRAQTGQAGQPYIDLPAIEPGMEKAVLRALSRMGRVKMRARSNDFGNVTIEFTAAFELYSLRRAGSGAFIRGESGGGEILAMLNFMRRSRRFSEIENRPKAQTRS